MKKLSLAAIIVTVSISLIGCTNSGIASNGNKNNTDSSIQNSNESNVQNSNESNTQNNNINNTGDISLDKAKEIALSHAGLSSDQVTFVQANKDFDDGIQKYDIEFYCNGKEYDYEINASNGQIIKYDYDAEYDYIQNNNNQSNVNNIAKISEEEAKQIVLSHAGLTSNQVTFKRTELDFDYGIQKYEVEFYYNNREYNYEIDANTGDILAYEQD